MLKYLIKYRNLKKLKMLSWMVALLIICGSCQEENYVKNEGIEYELG